MGSVLENYFKGNSGLVKFLEQLLVYVDYLSLFVHRSDQINKNTLFGFKAFFFST